MRNDYLVFRERSQFAECLLYFSDFLPTNTFSRSLWNSFPLRTVLPFRRSPSRINLSGSEADTLGDF